MVELGAALRREGDPTKALELLEEGLELAVSTGSQPLVERCEAELEAAGAQPSSVYLKLGIASTLVGAG
jgi:hypothetical protein